MPFHSELSINDPSFSFAAVSFHTLLCLPRLSDWCLLHSSTAAYLCLQIQSHKYCINREHTHLKHDVTPDSTAVTPISETYKNPTSLAEWHAFEPAIMLNFRFLRGKIASQEETCMKIAMLFHRMRVTRTKRNLIRHNCVFLDMSCVSLLSISLLCLSAALSLSQSLSSQNFL